MMGRPIMRPMEMPILEVLNFQPSGSLQDDPNTWNNTTKSQYMFGGSFLVAPIYTGVTRNLYLPAGKWIDYWTGDINLISSGQTISVTKPVGTIPLFVKAGAIIPLRPIMNFDDGNPYNPLTLEIYPEGASSYSMYEDDSITKQHRTGSYARTVFTVTGAPSSGGEITVDIGTSSGNFTGKLANRKYLLNIHTAAIPTIVKLDGVSLSQYPSQTALDAALDGWFYDAADQHGLLHVKTQNKSTSVAFQVKVTVGVEPTPGPTSTPAPTATAMVTATPTPSLPTVNDDDVRVEYSAGWTDNNAASGSINGDEHYTNGTNNYAQFRFSGTKIQWIGTKSFNRGIADVYIDDVYDATVDLYAVSPQYQQIIYEKTNLTDFPHTIKVVCKGTKNAASSSYYIIVDAFRCEVILDPTPTPGGPTATPTPTPISTPTPGGPTPTPVVVNDDHASITYNGAWTDNNTATGSINGDEHYTKVTGNYAQFTFTGVKIEWVLTKSTNRGNADVYLDGVYDATVDLYSSTLQYQQVVYTKSGLTNGSHTIKVICKGTKNSGSSDYYIIVDAFRYSTQ